MTNPHSLAQAPDQATGRSQRFGHITGHQPAADGPTSTYFVRDEETDATYEFDDTDIVTEGFRTLRAGERVRFLIDNAPQRHASYVIRLDLPEVREYYP